MIKYLKDLSYKFLGSEKKWEAVRYSYIITYMGNDFIFYSSVDDFKKNKKELSDDDLLMALTMIVEDALIYLQSDSLEAFLIELGYIEAHHKDIIYSKYISKYLSEKEIVLLEQGRDAYNGCRETFIKLRLKEDDLLKIIEDLEDKR